jgi:hypothetical protein
MISWAYGYRAVSLLMYKRRQPAWMAQSRD